MTFRPDFTFRYVPPTEQLPAEPRGKILSVDLETYAGRYGDGLTIQACNVRLVSMVSEATYPVRQVESGEVVEQTVVFVVDMMGRDWKEVIDFIGSYEIVLGHNLAFDLPILVRHGLPYPKKCWDTIIASRILHNGLQRPHGLGPLVKDKLDYDLPKELQTSDWSADNLSFEQLKYAANDVVVLLPLHNELYGRIKHFKLESIYELECAVLAPVADMTLNGVGIDLTHWSERSEAAEKKRDIITTEILQVFPRPDPLPMRVVRTTKKGDPYKADTEYNKKAERLNETRCWNLGSPVQLVEMLGKVGIEIPDTRYETLVSYVQDNPILDKIIQWRDLDKQAGTFGMDWLQNVHPDGRVYPQWWQLGAASGRFSCSGPNMQQVPRGPTRKAITAGEGCVLVRCDFSQIEARVAAKIAHDEVLLELFNNDKDIFIFTAERVLGKLEVTPDERQIGKSLVYGLLFSMSAPSLRVYCHVNYGVKLSQKEADVFRDRFFRTFTGLARWHDRMRKTCNTAKEFRSLLGRRRIVAHLQNNENANMLGLSLNTPVQGTAADMLKMAVREMWERRAEYPELKRVMLVHDEVVAEVPEGKAVEVGEWTKEIMIEAGAVILNPVPCRAEVKIGKTWGG